MSKRIVLSDREITQIVNALKTVQKETALNYQIVKAGQLMYQDIIDRLTEGTDMAAQDLRPGQSTANPSSGELEKQREASNG